MKQVLCSEQLRWLIEAQPSAFCRNHHSHNIVIASFDWMQWEKMYGISSLRFLAFSFFLFYYLWLLEWKGFWVIKKSFLFWEANIWSYFSGLSYFLYLLLPSSCMSLWNENASEKTEMFHLSLKDRKIIQEVSWIHQVFHLKYFFCFVLGFVLLPRKCFSPNFGQFCSYIILGRPRFCL